MPHGPRENDTSSVSERVARPLDGVKRVCVGSLNAPKLEGVRQALGAYLSGVSVEGVEVSSGVSEQPVGFAEIARGARNRAEAALYQGGADLGVGVEDGLVPLAELEDGVLNVGCAALFDGRRFSLGLSAGFPYPPQVVAPALTGEPIGPLFDRFFARASGEPLREPSALSLGNVGRLTLGVLPRAEYTRHAVLCALVRFLHPRIYFPEQLA